MSFYRAYFGLHWKGSGFPSFTGENFSIQKDQNGQVTIKLRQEDYATAFPEHVVLRTHDIISDQDMYRTLCKYVLSVIDRSQLSAFDRAIDWINGQYSASELPRIQQLLTYDYFAVQPYMTIYTRSSPDKRLPHVIGEFRYACLVFVFVVPFSNQDDLLFVEGAEFDYFWQQSIYAKNARYHWQTLNWSSDAHKGVISENGLQSTLSVS